MKSESVHVRVDSSVKASAESVLANLGLSTTDAINMFLRQVVYNGGIPFDVKMPKANALTLAAMKEADKICANGKGYDNIDDMFKDLDADVEN